MRPWAYWASHWLVNLAVMWTVGTVGTILVWAVATPGGQFIVLWALFMLFLVWRREWVGVEEEEERRMSYALRYQVTMSGTGAKSTFPFPPADT